MFSPWAQWGIRLDLHKSELNIPALSAAPEIAQSSTKMSFQRLPLQLV